MPSAYPIHLSLQLHVHPSKSRKENLDICTVKKGCPIFPFPAGMSLTKLVNYSRPGRVRLLIVIIPAKQKEKDKERWTELAILDVLEGGGVRKTSNTTWSSSFSSLNITTPWTHAKFSCSSSANTIRNIYLPIPIRSQRLWFHTIELCMYVYKLQEQIRTRCFCRKCGKDDTCSTVVTQRVNESWELGLEQWEVGGGKVGGEGVGKRGGGGGGDR